MTAAETPLAADATVIDDPLRVADARDVTWSAECDVIVAGFGGAGASSALEAHERGADVLILERFEGGGATAKSGGIYYAGGGTKAQQDAGVSDSTEEMFKYLSIECDGAVSDATLRRFCEESPENFDWLVDHGIGFEGSLYSNKTNYPPEDKYLYYSGNEKVPAFAEKAKPAARGHRAKGAGWTGYKYFEGLETAVRAHDIAVATHHRVVRLVCDANDYVIGVEALAIEDEAERKRHSELYRVIDPMKPFNAAKAERAIVECAELENRVGVRKFIRARNGVVLTTGGFVYNLPMVGQHMPFLAERNDALMRLGSMGCMGSGIQLGMSVGGAVSSMNHSFLGRMIAPPSVLVEGLLVNRRGERFVNEDAYNALLGDAIGSQPDGDAWIILDGRQYWRLLRQCLPKGDGTFKPYLMPAMMNLFLGGTKKASSLAGLAHKLCIDPDRLQATVDSANSAAAEGRSDPLGKNPDYIHHFGKGPYRALNTSVGNKYSFFIFFTLGGLKVDELTGNVLRNDGTRIDGLYAAGRAAMGLPSNGYISGLSLADCVFSGRRAGREAALASQ